MCLGACNTRTNICHEIYTPYYYEVSFYLSNEGLFEMMTLTEALKMTLTEALKINVKVVWSPLHVSQNCHISPAQNQFDLELWYKVFFFTDSCRLDIAIRDSGL